jgi:hypothetical protein
MLRPTLAEILSGIQRTIMETLFPELTSPYAQGQAAMISMNLSHAVESLESAPAYDAAEIGDLKQTLFALGSLAAEITSGPFRNSSASSNFHFGLGTCLSPTTAYAT